MDLIDKRDEVLRTFLEYGIGECKENDLTKTDLAECAEAIVEKLTIPVVGWRSEQLPDFDVEEINEIVKDCKEKKENIQALICRIWNKGYMTAVADEREG